jgi:c-di-GMP-binding flagellar brake protein YcgR
VHPAFGRYPRVRVDLPAECTANDITFPAHILTLGGGGLLLEMAPKLQPNTEIRIRFRPATHLSAIEATVSVRYQLPGQGTGVEFTEIRTEDRQTILQVIFRRISSRPVHARKKFVAKIEDETGTFLGFSRDISIGGLFIETRTPLLEGSVVKLSFHLEDGGPVVLVQAEIRYMIPDLCMGVEFLDLPASDRSRIEAYVTKVEPPA